MATYLYADVAPTTDNDDDRFVSFSSGMHAMPELEDYAEESMPALEFSALLEAAILRLYRSPDWGWYVRSGAQARERETLESGGLLVWRYSDMGAQEGALLAARQVVALALEHDAHVRWD